MSNLLRLALLITLIGQSLPAADAAPDDATLIAMAHRRLAAGDFGMSMEQMFRRAAGSRGRELPRIAGAASVMKRGVAAAGGIPDVRFRVPVKNDEEIDGNDDVLVIDARITRDSFGDLSMEWRYNVDQTLAERERQSTARRTEKEDLDHRFPDRVTEARAITALRSTLFPAQIQFQGGAYEDRNKNDIGDFAQDFQILSGERTFVPREGANPLTLNLLPKGFLQSLEKEGFAVMMLADNERGFWCFVVLPSRAKTLAIDVSGTPRILPGVVQPADIAAAKQAMTTGTVYKRTP